MSSSGTSLYNDSMEPSAQRPGLVPQIESMPSTSTVADFRNAGPNEPLLSATGEQERAPPEKPWRSPRVAAVLELARTLHGAVSQLHSMGTRNRGSPNLSASSSTRCEPRLSFSTPRSRAVGSSRRDSQRYRSDEGVALSNGSKGVFTPVSATQESAMFDSASTSNYSRRSVRIEPTEQPVKREESRQEKWFRLHRHASTVDIDAATVDIVQMTSPLYFAEESERKIQVDIMRLGTLDGKCKVEYYTEDGSAIAGKRYRKAEGQVVFKEGEHTKSVDLYIISTDQWAATLEFKIHLRNPVNCEVGQYLNYARIKIIDNDMFPSSRYEEDLVEGEEGIARVPGWKLMVEYFKLNLGVDGIAQRTILILLLDQIHNMYKFLLLKIQIYMVDVLFNLDERAEEDDNIWIKYGPENGRIYTARLIALLYIVPMVALHLWDVQKVYLDVGGISREYLQVNLFRKYLNYSEDSRQKVPASHMQVAMIQDCDEVADGYTSMLQLLQVVGKLVIVTYFILEENPSALISVLVMPALMILFVYFRSTDLVELTEKTVTPTAEVISLVHEATTKYGLIADYQQRPHFCEIFEERSKELTEARLPLEKMIVNNNYAPRWLGPIFTGVYIAMNAHKVFEPEGNLPLGVFLATARIFAELSENFEGAYEELMEISSAVGPLRKLTQFLNEETDLKTWKDVNRQRRELTKSARLDVMHGSGAHVSSDEDEPKVETHVATATNGTASQFRTDQINLTVRGVNFNFIDGPYILKNVNVNVLQGSLVAVVGEHGSGKSTLLRLMGQSIFPREGRIFIPTHLRILHVAEEYTILNLNAWSNLTFGRHQAIPKRVGLILKAMNMESTLELVRQDLKELGREGELHYNDIMATHDVFEEKNLGADEEEEQESDGDSNVHSDMQDEKEGVVPWQEKLSATEKNKIHLARALIMNPEVMVLHRPCTNYDTKTAANMMRIIKEHVQNRGFQVSSHTSHRRRPRTCFFTPSNVDQMLQADRVWLCRAGTVKDMDPQELVDEKHKKKLDFFDHDSF